MIEDECGNGRRDARHDGLADLLGKLDEFLRSRELGTLTLLTQFMEGRGHPHPEFAACNLIDELSFTASRLAERSRAARRTSGPPSEHGGT